MHPVLFTISLGERALPVGGYGALLCLALLVGGALLVRAGTRAGLDAGAIVAALGLAVGFGFAGGVVLHGAVQWMRLGSLSLALAAPGLAFYGAALGGLAGLTLGCRLGRLPLARLLDLGVPALAVGHALGRIGCLLGGCCHGRPSELAFAVRYEHPLAPAAALPQPLHPVPLYEAAGLLALAFAYALWPARHAGSGRRAASYVALYALLRIALEDLRGDVVRGVFGGVSTSQLFAGLSLIVAVCYLCRPVAALRRLASSTLLSLCALSAWTLSGLERAAADAVHELTPRAPAVVRIEGGWFAMGSDEADVEYAVRLCRAEAGGGALCAQELFAHEHPRHRVFVGPFAIDRAEVDNESYRRCVRAGACRPARTADHDARLGHPRHPVAGVTWGEARAYCRWVGGDLPSEAQWEYAARGPSRRRFPWGQHYNSRVANHGPEESAEGELDGYRFAAPVEAFPDGRSASGLWNMAGNVWELVADRYDGRAYEESERVDPRGPREGDARVIRGGSWRSPAQELRVTHRAALPENESRPDVGFRCAYNVP